MDCFVVLLFKLILVSHLLQSDSCTVNITVLDVNDNPPEFSKDSYGQSVLENVTSAFVQVSISDSDKQHRHFHIKVFR